MTDLRCSICNKPYIEKTYTSNGYTTTFPEPQCTCEEEAQKKAEAAERERERLRRIDALHLPLIFAKYRLDNLECEHVADAEIYVHRAKARGFFSLAQTGTAKPPLRLLFARNLPTVAAVVSLPP